MMFFSKVWATGNSLVITIPVNYVKAGLVDEGDFLQIKIINKKTGDTNEKKLD